MDIDTLINGGTTWQERLEDSLRRIDVSWGNYTRNKPGVTREIVQKRFLLPIYVPDFTMPVGERWTGVFETLEKTKEHQTIGVPRNQFFPPMNDRSLPKRWYLLPAKRWEYNRDNLSVREAQEEQMNRFTLDHVKTFDDLPIGFDFEGIGPNTDMKPNTPYNWYRGRKMYGSPLFRKRAKVVLQAGREDLSQAFSQGISVNIRDLPSLAGESAPHDIVLTNVPVYEINRGVDERTKRIGYGIRTSDDCERHIYSNDKFTRKIKTAFGSEERVRSENEFDHHSIYGIEAGCDLIAVQYPGLAIDNPIPALPDGFEKYIDFAFKRIRVMDKNEGNMMWESKALMQIYGMAVIGYLNAKNAEHPALKTAADYQR
ncbi:MAG: hypothetical protein V1836_00610 [Candidatus Aenigmatarchaeota archaeon]